MPASHFPSALLVATLLVIAAPGWAQDNNCTDFYPPHNTAPRCNDPSIQNQTLYYDDLTASPQMPAQVVTLRVGVPFKTLIAFFGKPQYWPVWNHLFGTNFVTNYTLCAGFNNVTYTNPPPVQPPFPAGMQAPHWIDQHGFAADGTYAFGWIFQLLQPNGTQMVFGRHTFSVRQYVDESGVEASVVQSFEKAAGAQLDTQVNQVAWTIALQESAADAILGFQCLELAYTITGAVTIDEVRNLCPPSKSRVRRQPY